ncbi:hypothetical protein, partial [Streptomyces afghaniensis]|uniref:hypothetical protein n=1 Tax=Streptomyces afghaniensis TaxID=66865 RepID=UPI003CC8598C
TVERRRLAAPLARGGWPTRRPSRTAPAAAHRPARGGPGCCCAGCVEPAPPGPGVAERADPRDPAAR